MKYLLVLFFVTHLEAATLIHWVRPVSTGTETLEVREEKNSLKLIKTSNWFNSELSIGEFVALKSGQTSPHVKALLEIKAKIKAAEQKLASVGTSYNALNEGSPHLPFFMVDETKILEGSTQYKEIVTVLDKVQLLPFKLENGSSLSKDFKTIGHVTHGKKTKEEKFRMPFYCDRKNPPTRCLIPNRGVLYLN